MFSNVKKYSKNYKFKKVRNSNDQTLSSFGTFQTPPFLFGSMKKLAIHVLYTTQQLHCSGNYALLSVLQWAGCLPSTKSTHHHNLLLLLHNWSAFVRWMCAYAHLHKCALQIVQSTQSMCFSRLCIAQLCKRRLCASVCDLITRRLRPPGYDLCIRMCSRRCRCLHMFRFLRSESRPGTNLVRKGVICLHIFLHFLAQKKMQKRRK